MSDRRAGVCVIVRCVWPRDPSILYPGHGGIAVARTSTLVLDREPARPTPLGMRVYWLVVTALSLTLPRMLGLM